MPIGTGAAAAAAKSGWAAKMALFAKSAVGQIPAHLVADKGAEALTTIGDRWLTKVLTAEELVDGIADLARLAGVAHDLHRFTHSAKGRNLGRFIFAYDVTSKARQPRLANTRETRILYYISIELGLHRSSDWLGAEKAAKEERTAADVLKDMELVEKAGVGFIRPETKKEKKREEKKKAKSTRKSCDKIVEEARKVPTGEKRSPLDKIFVELEKLAATPNFVGLEELIKIVVDDPVDGALAYFKEGFGVATELLGNMGSWLNETDTHGVRRVDRWNASIEQHTPEAKARSRARKVSDLHREGKPVRAYLLRIAQIILPASFK